MFKYFNFRSFQFLNHFSPSTFWTFGKKNPNHQTAGGFGFSPPIGIASKTPATQKRGSQGKRAPQKRHKVPLGNIAWFSPISDEGPKTMVGSEDGRVEENVYKLFFLWALKLLFFFCLGADMKIQKRFDETWSKTCRKHRQMDLFRPICSSTFRIYNNPKPKRALRPRNRSVQSPHLFHRYPWTATATNCGRWRSAVGSLRQQNWQGIHRDGQKVSQNSGFHNQDLL